MKSLPSAFWGCADTAPTLCCPRKAALRDVVTHTSHTPPCWVPPSSHHSCTRRLGPGAPVWSEPTPGPGEVRNFHKFWAEEISEGSLGARLQNPLGDRSRLITIFTSSNLLPNRTQHNLRTKPQWPGLTHMPIPGPVTAPWTMVHTEWSQWVLCPPRVSMDSERKTEVPLPGEEGKMLGRLK